MRTLIAILLFASVLSSSARVLQVGSGKRYPTPNLLYRANVVRDGDTIEIDARDYVGAACLAAWKADDLLIRGVGGRPRMVANGQYIQGKGIWVLAGDNITVENISFFGATVPDHNGAGIRLDGEGLTVRHCVFTENENGILTSNPYSGDVLIEYSEFDHNGYGDGYSHNLYIGHVGTLTFSFNYSHHADVGHNLKSRAEESYIFYNRIADEETGRSSRLIDLSNGGRAIVMGNILIQGENASNGNVVGYGLEGLSAGHVHEFNFVNNTVLNRRNGDDLFVEVRDGLDLLNIANNIFAGPGDFKDGVLSSGNGNFIEPIIENVGFLNEEASDTNLTRDSGAVDYGVEVDPVEGYSLTPDRSYMDPLNFRRRTVVNGVIDAGAYEFGSGGPSEVSLIEVSGDRFLQLTLSKGVLDDGKSYGVQVSSDLTTWEPESGIQGEDGVFDILIDSASLLVVRDRTSVVDGSPRFMRVTRDAQQ